MLENFLVAILEHLRNSIPYRIYENASLEHPLSNRDTGIAEMILRVKIFGQINFWPQIYKNSLEDQWLFGNI